MKYTWIFLVLALFSFYIANFLYRNQSPWNKVKINQELATESVKTNTDAIRHIQDIQDVGLIWDYINLRSFLLLFVFVDAGVACAFGSVHSFADKLFFKKFYEEPDWKIALRRGLEVAIFLNLLVVLRLSASLSVFTAVPLFLVTCGIEYIITGKTTVKTTGKTPKPHKTDIIG